MLHLLIDLLGIQFRVFDKFAPNGFIRFGLGLVRGYNRPTARSADLGNRGIDDDSRNPGQKVGATAILVKMRVGLHHGFLNGILGILGPGKNAQGARE